MTLEQAIDILGINRTRQGDIAPMVKALSFGEAWNSKEDNERLAAGRFMLRRWAQYQTECNKRRDSRFARRG